MMIKEKPQSYPTGMKCTALLLQWMGGVGVSTPIMGASARINAFTANVDKEIVADSIDKEALAAVHERYKLSKYMFEPRADIYSEIQKIPLRFKLHPFSVVQEHCNRSPTGYGIPLGAADADDVIPFHVHRGPTGRIPAVVRCLHTKIRLNSFCVQVHNISGDIFRFEDELIKIFPTKKTFVRPHCVYVYNSTTDALSVLFHWIVGLGF